MNIENKEKGKTKQKKRNSPYLTLVGTRVAKIGLEN
jgi:hypothetical protein